MKMLKKISTTFLMLCMMVTCMPMSASVYAEDTYSVSYTYEGDLPSQVTATLPTDSNTYADGTTVTAQSPTATEVVDDDGDTYTFSGWDEESKVIDGGNIVFTGYWDVDASSDDFDDNFDFDDESEFESEDSYDPNPEPPASLPDKWKVKLKEVYKINGGTHGSVFEDEGYGVGLCCYHKRSAAKAGAEGWMRELESSADHYNDIKRALYWGMYKQNDNPSKGHAFSIHLMLSYWRNGNKSLTSGVKEGTSRFKTAKKYVNTLLAKGDAPSNFHVYEWIGTGSNNKKQILLTYKIVNSASVNLKKSITSVNTDYNSLSNYTLAGAVYNVYTDAACTTQAYSTAGSPVSFTTDSSGNTSTIDVELDSTSQTLYAKEITAPNGYLKDSTVHSITVTAGGSGTFTVSDTPTWGELVSLRKTDKSGEYGWRKMLGAEYTLRYYDVDPSTTDVSSLTPTKSWVFKTVEKKANNGDSYAGIDFDIDSVVSGDSFYTEAGSRIMPIGVWTVEETKAPAGLARNASVYYGKVYQPSNGASAVTTSNTLSAGSVTIEVGTDNDMVNDEARQSVVIEINKLNAQTGENAATESENTHSSSRSGAYSTLAGAKYEVYYDDPDLSKPELVGVITTDENGYASLSTRQLGNPYLVGQDLRTGTYIINELSPAPGFVIEDYQLSDGTQITTPSSDESVVLSYDSTVSAVTGAYVAEDIEVIYDYDDDGNPLTKTIFGYHKFATRAEEGDTTSFTYTITSKDTGTETYVSKTDITTGEEIEGATLRVIDSDGNVVEEWTSTDEVHLISELPTGTYTLREITAPYGYDVAEDVEFTIEDNTIVTEVEMQNKPITIETTATNQENGTHQGEKNTEEVIVDTVELTGLYEGREYKLEGKLVNQATKEVLTDSEGNEITAELTFTAESEEETKELTFTIDSSLFANDVSTVAYETLFRTSSVNDDEVPIELQNHEDPDDEAQTIHYGGIVGTVASEKESGEKNVLADEEVVVVDVVEYENLSTEETYVIKGELYDKTTGALTGITASTEFTPALPSGKVTIEFKFDASELKSHTLVAFESLMLNSRLIDEHNNPDDEDQTVYVPEIGTKIGTPKGKKVVDTVTYSNLIPGKTYVMKGYFVDRKTGKKIKNSDGTKTFTPESADGKVEVTLHLAGASDDVVAYEFCYIQTTSDDGTKLTLVGQHNDKSDKKQTLKYSAPKTGDSMMIFFYGGLLIFATVSLVIMRKRIH